MITDEQIAELRARDERWLAGYAESPCHDVLDAEEAVRCRARIDAYDQLMVLRGCVGGLVDDIDAWLGNDKDDDDEAMIKAVLARVLAIGDIERLAALDAARKGGG